MKQDMKRNLQLIDLGFTTRKHHTYASHAPYLRGANSILSCRYLRSLVLLAVMMVGGATGAWGQTDYSGQYFIASNADATFYLCPAEGYIFYDNTDKHSNSDTGMPFLTTYKCDKEEYDDKKAYWKIQKDGDYYNIIHVLTGKYLTLNGQISGASNANRMRFHLETITTPGDNQRFIITKSGETYTICPKSSSSNSLNPAGGNKDNLAGDASGSSGGPSGVNVGGIVGMFASTDGNSKWKLVKRLPRPHFTVSDDKENITISELEANSDIYYTVDKSEPTSSSTLYSETFSPVLGTSQVKVIAISKSDATVTSLVATYNLPQAPAPTITVDMANHQATITSPTLPDGNIYYTTNGSNPTIPSTNYTDPISFSSPLTIKAIVAKTGYAPSVITTKQIIKVATPTWSDNGNLGIILSCSTPGATIHYNYGDTPPDAPTASSPTYTGTLTGMKDKYIKAIAVKSENFDSEILFFGPVTFKCATPVIRRTAADKFTITCSSPSSGVTIYYTTNGDTPTSSDASIVSGGIVNITASLPMTVKAIAMATGFDNSEIATSVFRDDDLSGSGTNADPYQIVFDSDFPKFVSKVNGGEGASACYVVNNSISASGSDAVTTAFSGTFDGNGHSITGLSHPLFNTVNGGTVKNVTLQRVAISSSDNAVGAIAGTAKGYSRIYNCGILPNSADFPDGTHPTVTTTGECAGGIVGRLEEDSRVINCYSYADVSASTTASGIVGKNTIASTAAVVGGKYTNLRTAVVNCMFYGNITGGTNQYGVYGGDLITNAAATGISSYNYYSNGSTFTTTSGEPTAYNCSFPADVRYLTQVEFHRSLLNSNRELCGWWVGSDVAPNTLTTTVVQAIPKDASLMAKWVLDTSIAPYPILKSFGKYASTINNPGNQTGSTLTVKVQSGSHSPAADKTLYIPITNMDSQHHDYGYYKVQLPYFNTVFGTPEGADWAAKYAGNYSDYVVTGWKVTAVTTDGSVETYNNFVADWQDGYNFADRKCTEKDLYSKSRRVFAQGGYYYVPDGVTGITIEAYWGKAIYVRNNEDSYDRVNITAGNTGSHFAPAGTRGNNINGATILSTSIKDALTAENIPTKGTVYDYALVLVGNVQESVGGNDVTHATDATRGFTIMSVDLDFDEEPDYCLEWQLGTGTTRQVIAPIRFDFLPVVELGIAGKLHNSKNFFSLGCYRSKGHFEVTETAFIHFGQFEFELKDRDEGPIILNGGIFDQYTRGRNGETDQHINYVIVGGHVVIPSFTPGAHVGQSYQTRHCAVNALGGDFNSFYLTGGYREDVKPYSDNPHCYIDGGHFGTVAAAYKEGISGDVTWRINHALIDEFYGGGVMSQASGNDYKIVKGSIDVVIDNSTVGKYCGGPKFGDMVSGKTVTTSATNTTFNQYFGAGNGGTNYIQYANYDKSEAPITTAASWGSKTVVANYHVGQYRNTAQGYEADYDYEVINISTGTTANQVVNRVYYYSAQFATTNTGSVTSTLTDCTIETDFYGGGFLGGVTGNVTSTLTDCTVKGSAYGAGFSASAGTVTIHEKDKTPPEPNVYTGMIKPQSGGTSTTYTWTHETSINETNLSTSSPTATGKDGTKYFYTEIPLDNLGAVSGLVTLTITGTSEKGSVIGTTGDTTTGNVYGGGDASAVNNTSKPADASTTVTLKGNTEVLGNVFGGGNRGMVSGSTTVNIQE